MSAPPRFSPNKPIPATHLTRVSEGTVPRLIGAGGIIVRRVSQGAIIDGSGIRPAGGGSLPAGEIPGTVYTTVAYNSAAWTFDQFLEIPGT